jgi:murein DD-endopeptidase MepM/ murein hydrolase activator NlpD
MSFKLRVTNVRQLTRIALLGATAGLLAGCSSEVTRFAEAPGAVDPTPTGTALIPSAPVGQETFQSGSSRPLIPSSPIRSSGIQSSPLPAPNPSYAVRSTPNPTLPSLPSSSKATTRVGEATSTIQNRAGATAGNWSAIGGTPVTVAKGESLSTLSDRYGVPQDVLLKTNGMTSSQVQPGARMVIPVYSTAGTATASPVRQTIAKVETPKAVETVRQVAKVEPKAEVAKTAKESLRFTRGAEPAAAKAEVKKVVETAKVPAAKAALGKPEAKKEVAKVETKKVEAKPEVKKVDAKAEQAAKDKLAQDKLAKEKAAKEAKIAADKAAKDKADKQKVTKVEAAPVETKKPVKTDPTPTATLPKEPAKEVAKEKEEVASASDTPEFRWPARGRVIQGFKAGSNDGINISVPEGTSVKAAESGVVAYAGSELKGYGNLVLIRHPNGFVSAYAHNGEIEVKRGDVVKRGQTIAKSGQTGNVSSPQLHFELRKGSTPVDPTGYLAGL